MKPQTPESAERRIASAPSHYRSLIAADTARFAVIHGARTVREAERYLPNGYALMESFEVQEGERRRLVIIIGGHDLAGWTLDGYVIPRLASGLMRCEEITQEPAEEPAPDPLPAPGTRVRLAHAVDRFPHFIAAKDACGTVVDIDESAGEIFAIRMDVPLEGAEDWDNEIHWYLQNGDDPRGSYEVIADDFVNHDALRASSPTELAEIVKAGGPAALIDAATALLDEQHPMRTATMILRYRPIVDADVDPATAVRLWEDTIDRLADEIAESHGFEVELHFEDISSEDTSGPFEARS